MSKFQAQLRRPWVFTVVLLTLVAAIVSATAVISYNRGWGNHRAAMLVDLPQHDANLVERTRRAAAGLLDIDRLPEGVDRDLAAKAEAERQGFAYMDAPGCNSIVLRLPGGRVVAAYTQVDAVGGQQQFGERESGCSGVKRPGPGLPPRPPVSERPARWDAAILTGNAYVYAVPVNGKGAPGEFTFHAIPHVRVDVSRCAGYLVPVATPRRGIAIPPTAPMADPSSVSYCFGIVPGE